MRINFHGGAGTVTGANYLLEVAGKKILVDCGLNQGSRYGEELNFQPFSYSPKDIEALFVTHAHIDHVGRIPKLKRDGFRGQIYSTPPTKDFAELMLIDSEHILNEEARHLKHNPLYTTADIIKALGSWEAVPYHKKLGFDGFSATFYDAGHILGSSFVVIEGEGKKIVFSGDLGNTPDPILRPTENISGADYCLVESAYGGRVHEDEPSRRAILREVIESTVKSNGVLMIPSFALERTQEILYELNALVENKRVPKVPVFLDSPLAISLTAVYKKYEDYFNAETQKIIRSGDQIFDFRGLHLTMTTEQSKEINDVPNPKVIIAGSGMSNGGRILHHERRYLSDPRSAILFVGFQAVGSLGRRIMDGEKMVQIFGEDIPVRCKIKAVGGYSSHADQPLLVKWLSPMEKTLKKVFVIQGEPEESQALADKAKEELGVNVEVPHLHNSSELV